jgi:hypothetical protein
MNRILVLFAGVVALIAALAVPAAATRSPAPGAVPAEGHKITICHATRSLSNPYVEIEIDVAAWNDPSDPRHHGDHHTRTKDGITWKDYVLTEGECSLPTTTTSSTTTTTRPPVVGSCAGVDVNVLVDVGFKLWNPEFSTIKTHQTYSVDGLSIPAGSYSVVLGSWDSDHPGGATQSNEQWRVAFSGGPTTGFTGDIGDSEATSVATAKSFTVGRYDLPDVASITVQHWSVANPSYSADSVYALCVGLIVDND